MNTIGRLAIVLTSAALAGGLAGPVAAADSQTVGAEVSIVAPCLTVSTTYLDFGATLLSRPDVPFGAARQISYRDCSGFGERIYGRGTNAAETGGGTGAWQLTASNLDCTDLAANLFRLKLRANQTGLEKPLLTVDQQLEYIGPDAIGTIDEIQLTNPCSGSDGVGSTMSFQIVFTASF